jgi:blue light- and temperature-responsive anti-repressor
MNLVQLVYHSRMADSSPGLSRLASFRQIHDTAMKTNRLNAISGFLVFTQKHFIQVLEGNRDAVLATYERIKRDMRHTDITLLDIKPTQWRAFPSWLMGAMQDDITIQEAMLNAGVGNVSDVTKLNAAQIIKIFSILADRTENKAA